MNYIERIKELLYRELNADNEDEPMPETDQLIGIYALSVLMTGTQTTSENIHDAWSVWKNQIDSDHERLIPYNELLSDI